MFIRNENKIINGNIDESKIWGGHFEIWLPMIVKPYFFSFNANGADVAGVENVRLKRGCSNWVNCTTIHHRVVHATSFLVHLQHMHTGFISMCPVLCKFIIEYQDLRLRLTVNCMSTIVNKDLAFKDKDLPSTANAKDLPSKTKAKDLFCPRHIKAKG